MTTQTSRMGWERLIVGLASWVGLCCAVSCSSTDQTPAGGRVEHPDNVPAPPPTTTTNVATSDAAPSPAPTPETPVPPDVEEQRPKTLAEDAPARPWSKNVPKRSCKKDDQCGDGFCDRGRCAAIWTFTGQYGQPCEGNRGRLPCIDGRLRSCVSDAECVWGSLQDPKCRPDPFTPVGHGCFGTLPSILPPAPPATAP
jgi:hypothetical protein